VRKLIFRLIIQMIFTFFQIGGTFSAAERTTMHGADKMNLKPEEKQRKINHSCPRISLAVANILKTLENAELRLTLEISSNADENFSILTEFFQLWS
jgi:hypothetical protein